MNINTLDVHALLTHKNRKHSASKLTNTYVEVSKRMTLGASTWTFGAIGRDRIALSEPLLNLQSASDSRSTLLQELIYALPSNEGVSGDGSALSTDAIMSRPLNLWLVSGIQ